MKQIDYLIVGQGIAGSVLASELLKVGQRVMVLNDEKSETSSNKAGGLYNPITGRMMTKTWLADDLFSDLESFYQRLEQQLQVQFIFPKTIYRPFISIEEQNDWQGKSSTPDYMSYVKELHIQSLGIPHIHDPFGGLDLKTCGYVDLPIFIKTVRQHLLAIGSYQTELFQYESMQINTDWVQYKDIQAKKVIFCEGPDATLNPYFDNLKFKLVKGELLEIEADLPTDRIINRGIFILPKNGIFRVGSTYDHSALDHNPTEAGKQNLLERLRKVYGGDVRVTNQTAGVRPATFDRRPFIGDSEMSDRVSIFNGFGTKGVSLVPFFATQFVNYLLGKGDMDPRVNPYR